MCQFQQDNSLNVDLKSSFLFFMFVFLFFLYTYQLKSNLTYYPKKILSFSRYFICIHSKQFISYSCSIFEFTYFTKPYVFLVYLKVSLVDAIFIIEYTYFNQVKFFFFTKFVNQFFIFKQKMFNDKKYMAKMRKCFTRKKSPSHNWNGFATHVHRFSRITPVFTGPQENILNGMHTKLDLSNLI